MKLLSALIISFGLSVSVWADETLDKARWRQSLTGIFSLMCSDLNEALLGDEEAATKRLGPLFSSFVMGYNLALKDDYMVVLPPYN